jgi:hypothetical protein
LQRLAPRAFLLTESILQAMNPAATNTESSADWRAVSWRAADLSSARRPQVNIAATPIPGRIIANHIDATPRGGPPA